MIYIRLGKLLEFINLNMKVTFKDIKLKVDKLLKDNNMKYTDVIIDERLSNTLYGNNSRVGKTIDFFLLRDLLEPNLRRDRSRL